MAPEVLGKGTKVRPYMLTRMPAYGSLNTTGLADDFAAADKNKIPPTKDPPVVKIREALKQGRLLVGAKGLLVFRVTLLAAHLPLASRAWIWRL